MTMRMQSSIVLYGSLHEPKTRHRYVVHDIQVKIYLPVPLRNLDIKTPSNAERYQSVQVASGKHKDCID